jgi:type IV fimbrial biogenesis protein FimT
MDSIPESYSDSTGKTVSTTSTVFRFTATGRLLSLSKPVNLQFGGGNYTQDIQRLVCVNLSGRARIAGDGSQSCSTDQ